VHQYTHDNLKIAAGFWILFGADKYIRVLRVEIYVDNSKCSHSDGPGGSGFLCNFVMLLIKCTAKSSWEPRIVYLCSNYRSHFEIYLKGQTKSTKTLVRISSFPAEILVGDLWNVVHTHTCILLHLRGSVHL
jgi:hypothetical protein